MPTKTIYIAENDLPIFDEAKEVAGETLSSIITRSLREFLARSRQQESGFREIAVSVGTPASEREQRFYGKKISDWRGFSETKEWWLQAHIYRTQKGNWAVLLTQVCKASLLTDKKRWKESGDYLLDARRSDLLVAATPVELAGNVPAELVRTIEDLAAHSEYATTFLDI